MTTEDNKVYHLTVNKQRLKLLIRGLRWYQSETNNDTEDFSNELKAMLDKDDDLYEDEKE